LTTLADGNRKRFQKSIARGVTMASVYDVAKQAGVSPATASRVLSGGDYPVRAATRDRVLRAAADLDFRPNRLARALVTARTSTFGAIVHDISDPYFGEIVRGMEETARLHGYQVFVCSSDRDSERELDYVRSLISYQVDGLLFAGGGIEDAAYKVELRKTLSDYRAARGAVVMLAPNSYRAPSVLPDNRGGATLITEHLIELGHRRIAMIAGPEQLRTSAVRMEGCRAALEAAGIAFDESLVRSGGFTTDGGAKATSDLIESGADFSAMLASNDLMAIGALAELQSRSIAVPDEVSVAGFDDVQNAAFVSVPLTTVRVPMHEMGAERAALLFDIVSGRRPRSRVLPVELITRRSTAPPPKTRPKTRKRRRS
jgi:LacI family transcriptional regulator